MDLKTVLNKGVKHEQSVRIGRGLGSGLGKTSGRGHKGWGQRSGSFRRPGYEGGQMPLYRRVPKRGFTNARFHVAYTIINVDDLNAFESGANVDLDAVLKLGLTSPETKLFKVLGNGALDRVLHVSAHRFSKSAEEKIKAAGGTVTVIGGCAEDPAAVELAAKQAASKAAAKKAKLAASEAAAEAAAAKAAAEKPAKKPKPAPADKAEKAAPKKSPKKGEEKGGAG
ncbi:MAG: 50S ribosomal protein L15 [Planctomycetota bacterium]|nr:MAG: 50S ribosomal protein L15 [Planctomycetota bacterium]